MNGRDDIAILGVGMHPWGKWGSDFPEYGVVAARAALADAGLAWTDIQYVAGADTIRNGYPGFIAGSTFAQKLGWTGVPISSSYAACASGSQALQSRAGPDPRRLLRRRPRDRRRHDAEGLLRRRSAANDAMIRTGSASTSWGRRTRCTSRSMARRRIDLFGATVEDFAQVKVKNARHGLENPNARFRKDVTRR